MKKVLVCMMIGLCLCLGACAKRQGYALDEKTFFLVMTNVQFYPDRYVGEDFEFDAFVYDLVDVDGNRHVTVARKCSAGYGCTCGKDTIIGFAVANDIELPPARNQSENNNDKTWLHIKGRIPSQDKQEIKIYAYSNGQTDYNTVETISFPTFVIEEFSVIEDYSHLSYYVTK